MTATRTVPPPTETPSFRKRYRTQGILAAVALMWLDYGLTYHGLSTNDPLVMGVGMVLMVAAVSVGYVFG